MQTATINVKINTGEAQKSVNDLNQTIGQTSNSTASLKLQLRQITQELQGLAPGSARFTELTQKAGQLRDTIADTNAVINATAGNVTENLGKGLTNVASIGVAAFQSVTAAQTLLGVESEQITQTIAKLTALMNLSQAIETFGGLGDKITQIKASFMGLAQTLGIVTIAQQATAVAATEAAVAEGAEAIAADAAAVSTGAFAISLNALPLVAIVTALGLLVAGLISYASSSSEAAKEEEKRKKQLEEQVKLEKERSDFIVKESSEFTTLIYRLKATNAGSKERITLIKQINTEYGTTLKNLSDEDAFQRQLNLSVQQYILLQYNRFKLAKNQEYLDQQNAKRFKAEQDLNEVRKEAQDLVDKGLRKSVADALSWREDLRFKQNAANQAIKEVEDATSKLGLSRNQLLQVDEELLKTGLIGEKQTINETKVIKEKTDAVEKLTDAQNKLNDAVKSEIETGSALTEQEKEILKARQNADKLLKLQADAVAEVEKNRSNGIYKTAADYKAALDSIKKADETYLKGKIEQFKKEDELERQKRERSGDVVIGGGGESPADKKKRIAREKALKAEMVQIKKDFDEKIKTNNGFIEELKREEERINKRYDDKNKAEAQLKLENLKLIQLEIQKIQLDSQQQEQLNLATSEEQKVDIRKSFADRIRLNEEELIIKQRDIALLNTELTEEQRIKIIKDSENKILKLRETTIEKSTEAARTELKTIAELRGEFSQKWSEDWMKTTQDLVGKIAEITSQITDLFSQAFQMAAENQIASLEQLTANEEEQLSASLLNREISEKEYEEKKKLLEKSAAERKKQIEIKEFNRQKALNIVNAVMNTAVGVTKALPNPVLMALAAVLGVAQVAIIASQQFRAAQGGVVPQNGQSGNIDSVPSLLAPGEVVVNSQSAQMFPQLLSDINQAGGGKRLVPDVAFTNPYNQTNVFQPQQQMVQAYVVESQITNSQRRISRMERAASF